MKKTYQKPATFSLLMQTDSMLLAASSTSGGSATSTTFGVTGVGAGLTNGTLSGAGTNGELTGSRLNEAW